MSKLIKLFNPSHSPHYEHEAALRVENVTVTFESGVALANITFILKRGERLAVVGPNGAGKSTLFNVIVGILKPSSGHVHIYGNDPYGHICIGYVPQRSRIDWTFPVTVYDMVMMGRIGKMGVFHQPKATDRLAVMEALKKVKMEMYAHRVISQLSGGQQQRVFIARTLAQEAELLLLDEPLTGLDVQTREDILNILDRLTEQKITILVALHDLNLAAERFPLVMILNRKIEGFGDPQAILTTENLMKAYGGHMHVLSSEDGAVAFGDTCCDGGEGRL